MPRQILCLFQFFILANPLYFNTNFTLPTAPSCLNSSYAACKTGDLLKKTDAWARPLTFWFGWSRIWLDTFKATQVITTWSQTEEPLISQVFTHHLLRKDFCDTTTTSRPLSYTLVSHFSFPSWKLSDLAAGVLYLFMFLTVCFPGNTSDFKLPGNTCKCIGS